MQVTENLGIPFIKFASFFSTGATTQCLFYFAVL